MRIRRATTITWNSGSTWPAVPASAATRCSTPCPPPNFARRFARGERRRSCSLLLPNGPGAQAVGRADDDATLDRDGRGPLDDPGAFAHAAVEDHLAGLAVDGVEL